MASPLGTTPTPPPIPANLPKLKLSEAEAPAKKSVPPAPKVVQQETVQIRENQVDTVSHQVLPTEEKKPAIPTEKTYIGTRGQPAEPRMNKLFNATLPAPATKSVPTPVAMSPSQLQSISPSPAPIAKKGSPEANLKKDLKKRDRKNEIEKINKAVSERMETLQTIAKASDPRFQSVSIVKDLKNPESFSLSEKDIKALTANGKYGLTVTSKGDAFLTNISKNFAKGGEKNIGFSIQLFRENQPLSTKSGKIFSELEIQHEQIMVHGSGLAPATEKESALVQLAGELKVRNSSITNYDHILQPYAITHYVTTQDGKTEEHRTSIIMPYCEGGDLRNAVYNLNNPQELSEFKQTASGMLNGIETFHQAGLIHLDIKPENFMLQNGVVKLADFGTVVHRDDITNPTAAPLGLSDYNGIKKLMLTNWEKMEKGASPEEIKAYQEFMALLPDLQKGPVILNALLEEKLDAFMDKMGKNTSKDAKNIMVQLKQLKTKFERPREEVLTKGGTDTYNSPELQKIKDDVNALGQTNPVTYLQSRDFYSLGVSLYQMTHAIPQPEIDTAYRNRLLEKANNPSGNLSIVQLEEIFLKSGTDKEELKEELKVLKEGIKIEVVKTKVDAFTAEAQPTKSDLDLIVYHLLDDEPVKRARGAKELKAFTNS